LEKRRRKTNRKLAEELQLTETTPNLVEELITKMEKIHQCVDELSKVHNQFGDNYSRESAYDMEIDW
jgi:hypothetical protein